jgi:rare lipoprotein A (peptidoglycan hydrolase)
MFGSSTTIRGENNQDTCCQPRWWIVASTKCTVGPHLQGKAVSLRASILVLIAKRLMIMKSHLFMVALLQVALLEPARAADGKPDECGLAWVYSTASEETASGDDTRPEDFTAAHRSLPFGTLIHVNNQENGRTVVVRITDRGPFVSGRIVDFYGHLEK